MDNEQLLNDYYKETEEKMRLRYLDLMLLDCENILNLIIKNIKLNKELKNNAYALNILSKKKKVQEYLDDNLTLTTLMILLNSEESKVRKNTYIMLGNLNRQDYSKFLLDALEKETVNYCLSSIVLSLGNYKIENISDILKKKMDEIENKYQNKEIEKNHYEEIKKSVEKVLLKNISFSKHEFVGFNDKRDFLLTVMPALKNASLNEIKSKFKDARMVEEGVLVSTNDYHSIFRLRTFYEALLCTKQGFGLRKENVASYISKVLNDNMI